VNVPIGVQIVAALIGLTLFASEFYKRRKLKESLDWPTVGGTIVQSDVQKTMNRDHDGGYESSYTARVIYRYMVDGKSYDGDRIAFGQLSYSRRDRAAAELAPYPLNAQVAVYFNPHKPTDSVLVRSAKGSALIICIGAAALGFVILTLIR